MGCDLTMFSAIIMKTSWIITFNFVFNTLCFSNIRNKCGTLSLIFARKHWLTFGLDYARVNGARYVVQTSKLETKKTFLSLIYESNEGNFETNCYWGTPKTDRISPVTFLPDCHVCRRLPGFKNNIVYRQINKMSYFTGNLWLFAIYQTPLTAPVNSALMCFE